MDPSGETSGAQSEVAENAGSLRRYRCHHEGVTTAIVLTLALVGVGIVIDGLLRLRKWLNNPPPGGEDRKPPDDPA